MTRRPAVLFVHYTFPGIVGGVETVIGHHADAVAQQADVGLVAGRGPVGVRDVRVVRIGSSISLHR
jgi:hypothetical protein